MSIFKTLLKVRFLSLANSFVMPNNKKGSSRGRGILMAVLGLYLLAVLVFMCATAMMGLAMVLDAESMWLYFGFAGFMAFSLCVITGIFSVQGQIFTARDNELLLSMPISHRTIIASRMAIVLIPDIFFTLLINATAFVVCIIYHQISILGTISLIINTLLIPILAFSVAALIGWLVSIITSKLPNKSLFTTALFLVFFVGYMYLCMNINSVISAFTLAVASGSEFVGELSKIFPLYHMGRAVSDGSIFSLSVFGLCAIIPFSAVTVIINKTFIKLATTKHGVRRTRYIAGKEKQRSPLGALLSKELKFLLSSPIYLLNSSVGIIFFVIAAVAAVFNIESLKEGNALVGGGLLILFAAGICLLSSMVTISASSVSFEGNRLWVVRSMPVNTKKVLLAKILLHLLLTFPVILLLSIVLCIILPSGILSTLVIIFLPQAYNTANAVFGVLINLKFPKLDYINEAQVAKQSLAVTISLLGGMAVVVIFGVLGLLLSSIIPLEFYAILCAVIFAVLSFILFKLLFSYGVKRFEEL